MKGMGFKILSIVFTVLFAWVFFPYKLIKIAIFKIRKKNAIRECEEKAISSGCRYYVVQNGEEFHVGKRAELRMWNSKNKRKFMPVLNIDYRNAIIYHCDANGIKHHYERNTVKKRVD